MSSSPADAAPARASRWIPLADLGLAVAFAALYLGITARWTAADFDSYVRGTMAYPNALDSFRYRVLMPALGGALSRLTGAAPWLVFRVLAVLGAWGIVAAFRSLLGNFMRAARAALIAPLILYPMTWNLCLLNRLYFPFDLPAILFVVVGAQALVRRSWGLFYPVLALACFNRETAGILIAIYLFGVAARLPRARRAAHLAAMLVIWAAIAIGIRAALGGGADLRRSEWLAVNLATLRDMATFRGSALKDWAKLLLCFGGLAWLVPFRIGRQPAFVRGSLWAIVPFVAATMLRGIVDEVRLYGELIPLVAAPAACTLADRLDRRGRAAAPR